MFNITERWQKTTTTYQNNEHISRKNKDEKLVHAVQINIFQRDIYDTSLGWQHFNDKPISQE